MTDLLSQLRKMVTPLKIKLNEPNAPFLANLAMSFMSILSKEYADTLAANKEKEKLDHYLVGTGPYIFKKYKKDIDSLHCK